MPRKCIVQHCNSNISGSTQYTPTFTIPGRDRDRWNLWKTKIREGSNKSYLKIDVSDTVCIKHFEDRFIVRSAQVADDSGKKPQRTKLSLTKDAYPTINMITPPESIDNLQENGVFLNSKPKAKRGSSGLANLQKARMRKLLRRERMQNLLVKRKQAKKETDKVVKEAVVKPEQPKIGKDFFLSDRVPSQAEKSLVALRISSKLNSNQKVFRDPPGSIRDSAVFPLYNVMHQVESLKNLDKNPINWTVDETHLFLNKMTSKTVANAFKSEKIDGEALMSIEMKDLSGYFRMSSETSEFVHDCISQLRSEVIKRFIHK